jgi:hypothetical protein
MTELLLIADLIVIVNLMSNVPPTMVGVGVVAADVTVFVMGPRPG